MATGQDRRASPAGPDGMCLAELLIAMTAGALVLSAMLQSLDHFQERLWSQIRTIDRQQELRIGLKILTDELRLAGTGASPASPPLMLAQQQEISFLANLEGRQTFLTAPVLEDALELSVVNGQDWPQGKRLLVCEFRRCRDGRLSQVGGASLLSLMEPLGQPFASGHPVIVSNVVRYYMGRNRDGQPTLMREVDGGANPLIAGVTTFRLLYADADGRPTTDLSRLSRIRIEVEVASGGLITTEVRLGGRT